MVDPTDPSNAYETLVPGREEQSGRQDGDQIGDWIGPYRILDVLGEGGMGTVYLAEQEHPVRRTVALKVIRQGMASTHIVARFDAERQALALMDHPHIARVLDAGSTPSGRPYFALELVRGVPITDYCDEHRLTPRQRLDLFVPVCHAIQHAHQKGIIHRDIKPSNILVTTSDGKPVPKVIDFGVAKATQDQLSDTGMHTQYGAVVGTLEYMSPEQAELSDRGVDTRTDLYSLGVVLYELLTGSTPLGSMQKQQASLPDMLRVIRDVEPTRPSIKLATSVTQIAIAQARQSDPAQLRKLMRRELDWIVMKCLEKDRERRYESANHLARDVERFLADEPVEACPPSTSYRLRRLARKHKGKLGAAVAFLLFLIASVVISGWQALRATRAEQQAILAGEQMRVERDRARKTMNREIADRLNGDLRRLAMAAEVFATFVAQRSDWQESELEKWMRTILEREPSVFALNLAFEPRMFDPQRDDYDLYLFRGTDGLEKKYLIPPGYLPVYREWDWYTQPKRDRRSQWSEPYVDTGGGEIPMVTYTVPIIRDEQFIGVVSLDLSVEYFNVLRGWLGDLSLGTGSYGFVVSRAGLIISHPDKNCDFAQRLASGQQPLTIDRLAPGDQTFQKLAAEMLKGDSGMGRAPDPLGGKPSTFLYSPISSADWMFIAVIPDES